MKRASSWVTVCSLFSAFALMATAAQAADLTVAGLSFGLSVADAKGVIGSGFKFDEITGPDPNVTSFLALNDAQSEAYVVSFQNNSLWYVQHIQEFNQANEPNVGALKASLEKKFGLPNRIPSSSPTDVTEDWIYDKEGHLPEQPATVSKANQATFDLVVECSNEMTGSQFITPKLIKQHLAIPSHFPSFCQKLSQAVIVSDVSNPEIAHLLTLSMADDAQIFGYLQKHNADIAEQKKKDAEKAKELVPKL